MELLLEATYSCRNGRRLSTVTVSPNTETQYRPSGSSSSQNGVEYSLPLFRPRTVTRCIGFGPRPRRTTRVRKPFPKRLNRVWWYAFGIRGLCHSGGFEANQPSDARDNLCRFPHRRPALGLTRCDVPGDVLRVPPEAGEHIGRCRVLEDQPHEIHPGLGDHHAAVVHGFTVLAEDRKVDPRELLPVAGAPDDVRDLQDSIVFQHRQSVEHAHHPRDAFYARGYQVLGLDPDQRSCHGRKLRNKLSADGRPLRQDVAAREPDDREDEPRAPAPMADRDLPRRLPREPRALALRELERDLGTRIAQADDEHVTLPQLPRVAVVARVEQHDRGVELEGEWGEFWDPLCPRRHHDTVGFEPALAGDDHVSVALSGEPVDADARLDRQVELGRVGLEVVGHLVLRGERPAGRREPPARQAVVLGRGEQAEGIPPVSPGVADPLAGIEDHERKPSLRQVVAGSESRLPTADDHGLEPLCAVAFHLRPPSIWISRRR